MSDTYSPKCDIGVAGLAGLGGAVAASFSTHSYQVAAYDLQPTEGSSRDVPAQVVLAKNVGEFVGLLRKPRTIFTFGENAAQTDAVIGELSPFLAKQDLLIDGSSSHFKDTERRSRNLAMLSIDFMGFGLCGNAEIERQGTIIMAGARSEVQMRTHSILEALACKVKGEACIGYQNSPAAAHFVGMVHAGIEYALMRLVSETFDLLQRALRLSDQDIQDVCANWRAGIFNDYLREFAANPSRRVFVKTGRRLLEERIADARLDSVVGWNRQCASELALSTPVIDAALDARTDLTEERQISLISTPSRHPSRRLGNQAENVLEGLHKALYAAMIITYSEGLALLAKGSTHYGFDCDLGEIALVWKAGCGVRNTLLVDIADALRATPALDNLLCDEDLAEKVMANQEFLRSAIWRASELGAAVPCLLAALDSLDSCRDAWLPVNLVQVQHQLHRKE